MDGKKIPVKIVPSKPGTLYEINRYLATRADPRCLKGSILIELDLLYDDELGAIRLYPV